tara:strand:+ start:394 stop:1143 length:750 start_codon:yes stop_codon:yes gene_type:complete
MKNYVSFNQGNFIKISKIKNIKVDVVDGVLFDWIQNFTKSGKALKKLVDNKLYIWVSYKAIREDNPMCNINTNDAIGRRLNKLVELNILDKVLSKKDGNKTFFNITQYAYDYLLESRELPTQKSEALPTQKSDNSKLIDSKLIEENKPTQKSNNSKLFNEYLASKETTKNEESLILDYLVYRKDIRKPITTIRPLNTYYKVILELHTKGYNVKQCIELMKNNEWQKLDIDWIKNSGLKSESFSKEWSAR